MGFKGFSILAAAVFALTSATAQPDQQLWHGIQRNVHYRPDGEDFVLVKGEKRFNRALYGTNTAFRVEAGDLPEFALYMPGMGGNLRFGIISGTQSKWIIEAEKIETRYRPGAMLYSIKDPLLGTGELQVTVLARADAEGLIVKITGIGISKGIQLLAAFGGATGKKFSRDGDIGADPESSFYLKPEYCTDNIFQLNRNAFNLFYGKGKVLSEEERYQIQHLPEKGKEKGAEAEKKQLSGLFPQNAKLKIGDANALSSPLIALQSAESKNPVLNASVSLVAAHDYYFSVQNPANGKISDYKLLTSAFEKAEAARKQLAGRVKVSTPDAYINTFGGALAVAADGIWEAPSYLHGAVAWRMRLNAWRGAYVADPLGWPERARLHFSSYAKSQVLSPEAGPVVMDTALHLARHLEKMGTSVFSSGYISRSPNDNSKPHHYDMNLVFFDQMLTHFYYTGDLAFMQEMWPVIKRHLAWEKRNFDNDGDGLYDAYAAIWASDALQYSGGGVTHTSSYNYRANKIAAQIAKIIGDDPKPYEQEADKILKAINQNLWLPQKGWYAEYKDLLGLKLVHPSAGLWTIYHAIDSDVPDAFQAYQSLRYIDTEIPHIPIRANGLEDQSLYTLSTTNWQPYDWSLNNVVLAEGLHTALSYWQGNRPEEAFQLWKGFVTESMYLSSSPGGFEQLSFYDAIRGELYRDFADPIGMAARSLVEGLYGIHPNALTDTLTIKPGFPQKWNYASLSVPNISFNFKRTGNTDTYQIAPAFAKSMHLKLQLNAYRDKVKSLKVNGVAANWKAVHSVGNPVLEIGVAKASKYEIVIEWDGDSVEEPVFASSVSGELFKPVLKNARLISVEDPQKALSGNTYSSEGNRTLFLKVSQGDFTWWLPYNVNLKKPTELRVDQEQNGAELRAIMKNNGLPVKGKIVVNSGKKAFTKDLNLEAGDSAKVVIPAVYLASGTNRIEFRSGLATVSTQSVNWSLKPELAGVQKVDLSKAFNDLVTNIFKNQYLSPRPKGPTLQLPWQGIGNWCYPLVTATIDDAGLRAAAATGNQIFLPNGVPLTIPAEARSKNILFTSKWDNYPDSASIPVKGKASHAYFLMAGSTNPMQTQMDNGELRVIYRDGTSDRLALRNPETWWPIEQDYYTDGFAFTTRAPKPYRVYFKTGEISRNFKNFSTIKGYSNYAIDGGAGTVLDMPLNPDKEIKEIQLKTFTNDVVIGLMAVTLTK